MANIEANLAEDGDENGAAVTGTKTWDDDSEARCAFASMFNEPLLQAREPGGGYPGCSFVLFVRALLGEQVWLHERFGSLRAGARPRGDRRMAAVQRIRRA